MVITDRSPAICQVLCQGLGINGRETGPAPPSLQTSGGGRPCCTDDVPDHNLVSAVKEKGRCAQPGRRVQVFLRNLRWRGGQRDARSCLGRERTVLLAGGTARTKAVSERQQGSALLSHPNPLKGCAQGWASPPAFLIQRVSGGTPESGVLTAPGDGDVAGPDLHGEKR